MTKPPPSAPTAPRSLLTTSHQLSIAFDSIAVQGINPTERAKTLTLLAHLLMQAANVVPTGGRDHDES